MSSSRRRFVAMLFACMALLATLLMPIGGSAQGNSEAAHLCQQGGYATLVGSNGETFANTGECVRFAARGGKFRPEEPVTSTATLTPTFWACNSLGLGAIVDGVDQGLLLVHPPQGCAFSAAPPVTYSAIEVVYEDSLELYLYDVNCGVSYTENSNHATVVATASGYQVDFADAGQNCEYETVARYPVAGEGNLTVDVDSSTP